MKLSLTVAPSELDELRAKTLMACIAFKSETIK